MLDQEGFNKIDVDEVNKLFNDKTEMIGEKGIQ
jgi:hypothetical protein